ncbi:hypothetical protein LCGC14_2025150 [marine sediment metagenome]|uniref:Uncharacterized protein n=1 Tax=marine sediment metagenome TaxID=412755 RepID=A0A0F9FIW5_9ZZZZ
MSNAPDVLFGLVPLVRAVVRSGSTTTATTVTADDSGTMFVNLGTSGTHTYTLPTLALSKGKHWIFFNGQTTNSLAITGGTTDKIIGVDDLNGDTITSDAKAGSAAFIFCDGTWFYAITTSGAVTTAGVWTVSS